MPVVLCVDALTVPLEVPQNFSVVNGSTNATSAAFMWLEVDTSFDRIRGFFRGYQVLNEALIILFCTELGILRCVIENGGDRKAKLFSLHALCHHTE